MATGGGKPPTFRTAHGAPWNMLISNTYRDEGGVPQRRPGHFNTSPVSLGVAHTIHMGTREAQRKQLDGGGGAAMCHRRGMQPQRTFDRAPCVLQGENSKPTWWCTHKKQQNSAPCVLNKKGNAVMWLPLSFPKMPAQTCCFIRREDTGSCIPSPRRDERKTTSTTPVHSATRKQSRESCEFRPYIA